MKHILTVVIVLIPVLLHAQEKTFIREYTYKAGEMDSKISCRAIAVNQLRSLLLQEIGVYVESEQILKTSDVDSKFSQNFVENISTISAGVTKLEILEEKWNGESFYMKASITVDPKSLEQSLKKLISDRERVRELEKLKIELEQTKLELTLLTQRINKGSNKNQTQNLEDYNKQIGKLNSSDYFFKATEKFDKKDYSGAILDLTTALNSDPNFVSAYFFRGLLKRLINDNSGASSDYSKVIEIDHSYMEAYVWRGEIENQFGDFALAKFDCSKVIEIDPKNHLAYLIRGDAKRGLKDFTGAMADYNKAIEINRNFVDAYVSRGGLKVDTRDFDGAIADCSKALEFDPNDSEAYFHMGIAEMLSGQKKKGCLDLRRAGELGNERAFEGIRKFCN